MTIKLYKFGPGWGVSDPSPFCVKLENFLVVNKIEHETVTQDALKSLKQSPKGKLPFVVLEDGRKLGDSALIIKHLSKERNIDMDAPLTDEERAISHAFCQMLDEVFYFVAVYSRWIDDRGWSKVGPAFFGKLPPLLRGIISEKVRKGVKQKLCDGQGLGKHSEDDIYAMGIRHMDALSAFLAEKSLFFNGKTPTMLDLTAHAFMINIIRPPIETPLKEHALTLQNLCDHAERMQDIIYGDQYPKYKAA